MYMTPTEALLLLTVARQARKVELLEILVQRLSARVLELYADARQATGDSGQNAESGRRGIGDTILSGVGGRALEQETAG